MTESNPPQPIHVAGTSKGEEMRTRKGNEPGRGGPGPYRTARDSTAIEADARNPIHPDMPNIPPS